MNAAHKAIANIIWSVMSAYKAGVYSRAQAKDAIERSMETSSTSFYEVIGVTPAALRVLSENKFMRPKHVIQFSHVVDRQDTFDAAVSAETQEEMFNLYRNNRSVVIALNEENADISSISFIHIANTFDRGLFNTTESGAKWRVKTEAAELKKIYENIMA